MSKYKVKFVSMKWYNYVINLIFYKIMLELFVIGWDYVFIKIVFFLYFIGIFLLSYTRGLF